MNGIRKTVKLLEDSGLLTKGVSETIKNEAKNQKGRFLEMLTREFRYYFIRKFNNR